MKTLNRVPLSLRDRKLKISFCLTEDKIHLIKKIRYYLIYEPIRDKINEFYFNKNTENTEIAQFLSDREAGIPIKNPLF